MLNIWSIYSDVALKSIRKSQKTIIQSIQTRDTLRYYYSGYSFAL
ncbi:hypothetical protein SAMN05444360_116121 [Chryseobacterium carnipullorum]|uniref:Uncharacterized protein n=1 Tax=Chryseobacterium indoltheticum TaxID=254 RepID=A0A381FHL7_9FLAO|nr:hypothetical protein SAMN05444360_116121 [Chryseobacterium carnipullorum]SUX46037.1 Uncharacterised protein [Chryseobacterium indoltheticum]